MDLSKVDQLRYEVLISIHWIYLFYLSRRTFLFQVSLFLIKPDLARPKPMYRTRSTAQVNHPLVPYSLV